MFLAKYSLDFSQWDSWCEVAIGLHGFGQELNKAKQILMLTNMLVTQVCQWD